LRLEVEVEKDRKGMRVVADKVVTGVKNTYGPQLFFLGLILCPV
jgi:hypothetical protein